MRVVRIRNAAAKLLLVALVSSVLVTAVAPPARAGQVTYTVDTLIDSYDGVCGGGAPVFAGNNPEDDCSIRDAIANANANATAPDMPDVINFSVPGTIDLLEDPIVDGQVVTVTGGGSTSGSLDVIDDLIIDGDGITLMGGYMAPQQDNTFAGTLPLLATILTIRDDDQSNFAGPGGTGGPDVTINGLTIAGGDGERGGGIEVRHGSLTMNDAVVRDNNAEVGGGIFGEFGTTVVLEDTEISGNTADATGGGVSIGDDVRRYAAAISSTYLTVIASNIVDNVSQGDGGGVATFGADVFVDDGSTVSRNEAGELDTGFAGIGDDLGFGGGLFVAFGSLVVEDAIVADNTAELGGGGVYVAFAYAGDDPGVQILDSAIDDNTVVGGEFASGQGPAVATGDGGGLLADSVQGLVIYGSTINGNRTELSQAKGGGLCTNSEFEMVSSTVGGNGAPGTPFAGNGAGPAVGGGIFFGALEVPTTFAQVEPFFEFGFYIVDTTIEDNYASQAGGGIGVVNQLDGQIVGVVEASTLNNNRSSGHYVPDSIWDVSTRAGGAIAGLGDMLIGVGNSTISGNSGYEVGGIYLDVPPRVNPEFAGGFDFPTGVYLLHVTMLDNVASVIEDAALASSSFNPTDSLGLHPGDGVDDLQAYIVNTVLQNDEESPAPNCTFTGTSFSSSAEVRSAGSASDDASCELLHESDAMEVENDFGALRNNGGSTETHALVAGTEAINAAVDEFGDAPPGFAGESELRAECLDPDQRGVARPQQGACDRGAYEFRASNPTDPEDPPLEPEQEIERFGGPSRVETAVLGSQALGEADAVVLSRADIFPDAQVGTPLAVELDAPILLTQPDSLHPATEAEIQRLLSPGETVHILGGLAAIDQSVEDRITELGFTVVRYAGANRFDTARIIAEEALGSPGTYLLADGGNFQHSILAGGAAVVAGDSDFAGEPAPEVGAAVLLTSGSNMPPETQGFIDAAGDGAEFITIGDTAAGALPAAENVSGMTAASLSVAVAQRFFDAPRAIGIATDADFADALVGSSILGSPEVGPGPMLFSAPDVLPGVVDAYLRSIAAGVERSLLFGGTLALATDVEDAVAAALTTTS